MRNTTIFLIKNLNSTLVSEFLPISITFGIYLQDLLDGSSMKNLVLPIAIIFFWFVIYLFISSIELYFAIEIVKDNNLNPEKPKRQIYKTVIRKSLENVVIGLLIFSLMSLCLLLELAKGTHEKDDQGWGYLTSLGIYVFFCLGSIIHKGLKIGESFEAVEGEKDEFFNLIGAFFLIFKKWFFDKTVNSFGGKSQDNINNQDNGKDI